MSSQYENSSARGGATSDVGDDGLGPGRWEFFRDVLVFQLKLLIDGLRDLLLSPVSLAAALVDLLRGTTGRRRSFYYVLREGRRTEDWIDLFEAADRIEPRQSPRDDERRRFDDLFGHLETLLIEEEARGGITSTVRGKIDQLLDHMSERVVAAPGLPPKGAPRRPEAEDA